MSALTYLKIFAGLGLFFVGINFLSEHLKNHGKPYIRKIIKRFAGSGWRCMLSGALSGALTNSAKAVTFSLAPIISSGMLTVPRALPIIIGASFGSALLVLWVSFDFKLMELFLLGMAGMYYQFGNMKKAHIKFSAGLFLGLGLIFFGLDMLKSGAAQFKDSAEIIRFAEATHGYLLAAFFLGAVSAFITQSGSTMSIVAITFVGAGLLDFDQAVMFVYGTNIGSGISTAMLSFGMAGVARQLIIFHAGIKLAGAVVLIPMLYVETYTGIPFMKAFAAYFAPGVSEQIGIIYVTYEVVAGAVMLLVLTPVARLLAQYWPPSHEETLSQAKFIRDRDNLNVDQVIQLIAKEQRRIMLRALRYFDGFRTDLPERDQLSYQTLHDANTSLQKEIHQALVDLSNLTVSKNQTEHLLHRSHIQTWIESLDKSLFELAVSMDKIQKVGVAPQLRNVILKALWDMLTALNDALRTDDPVKAHFLIESTKKRTSIFRRVKPKMMTPELEQQKTLMTILVTYERIVWLSVNMAHAVAHDDAPAPISEVLDVHAAAPASIPRTRPPTAPSNFAKNHPAYAQTASAGSANRAKLYTVDQSAAAKSYRR